MPTGRATPHEGRAAHARHSGARQSSLREANLRLVVQTVFGAHTPPSRADVAATTAMTRSTVSRLVDDLVAGGFVAELAPPHMSGPGRPATPLVPRPGTIAALGLQVNAGFLAAVVVDLAGRTLAHRRVAGDFVGSQPEPVLRTLGALGTQALADLEPSTRVAGAGLALPGIVLGDSGRLLRAPNLGWADLFAVPLLGGPFRPATDEEPERHRAGVQVGAQVGVRVGNEADLAAWTVAYDSPGRRSELSDFIYVTGEIGIGGAIVLDSRVMTGRHGWAGEIGHVCVDPDGPPCRCGSTGCLEQYVGAALLRGTGTGGDDSTDSDDPGAAEATTIEAARHLVQRAQSGDRSARKAVDRAAWALSVALAGVVNVVDIPTIVLGGHLAPLAAHMTQSLSARLGARVLSGRWVPPRIVAAAAQEDSGAFGAALRQLDAVLADPARWLSADS